MLGIYPCPRFYEGKRLKWCQYCRGPVNQASMGLRAVGRAVDAPQREASPSVSTENFPRLRTLD